MPDEAPPRMQYASSSCLYLTGVTCELTGCPVVRRCEEGIS